MITIDISRRVKEQGVIKYAGKFTVPLPDVFIDDNQIEQNEAVDIYRERINEKDALIIIPKEKVKASQL